MRDRRNSRELSGRGPAPSSRNSRVARVFGAAHRRLGPGRVKEPAPPQARARGPQPGSIAAPFHARSRHLRLRPQPPWAPKIKPAPRGTTASGARTGTEGTVASQPAVSSGANRERTKYRTFGAARSRFPVQPRQLDNALTIKGVSPKQKPKSQSLNVKVLHILPYKRRHDSSHSQRSHLILKTTKIRQSLKNESR